MQNYTNDNTARRYTAHISVLGTTQIHLRSPYIIAWWSAAFPGFGHLLLSKNIRGFVLFLWEIIINIHANINLGILYMFQGNVDATINIVDTRWLLVYMPVYLFTIWDSYRTTIDLNNIYLLSEKEAHPFNTFTIGPLEIDYLDKRSPIMALIWSLFIPGLGQLYIHRIFTAFFVMSWTLLFYYLSHALDATVLLFLGDFQQAIAILEAKWFLFLPSIYGFSAYDAYSNAIENNKLFEDEQKNFLRKHYQDSAFQIHKGEKVW